MASILLVDDEHKLLKIFKVSLKKHGYNVIAAANGQEAHKKIRESEVDIVFLDLKLPDCNGVDLLREFISLYPKKLYILMTAYANVENAVTAMKAGAFDYLIKPVNIEQLTIIIEKALEWLRVKEENTELREKLQQTTMVDELYGASSSMKNVFRLVERISNTDANVLIQGESGTGKSLIAKSIHNFSERCKAPFIPVNCAAIPEHLLETELFGHKKGAFTGAQSDRRGKFEAAEGGTIFLDEIGELSSAIQAKLLQVTQDKTYFPIGSDEVKQANVRIITATNKDLRTMVKQKSFREDLYYRLNIVGIYIPPLRQRQDDIHILIEKFLENFRKKHGYDYSVDEETLHLLKNYPWPGNVRELENAIERAVVLSQDTVLHIDDFPAEIKESMESAGAEGVNIESNQTLPEKIEAIEKQFILQALDEAMGQPAAAAKKLGISRQNLLYKMNKYFQ